MDFCKVLFLKDENLERAERAALGVGKLFSYGGPSTQTKVVFGSVKYAPSAADRSILDCSSAMVVYDWRIYMSDYVSNQDDLLT